MTKKKKNAGRHRRGQSFTCLHPAILVGIAILGIGMNLWMITTLTKSDTFLDEFVAEREQYDQDDGKVSWKWLLDPIDPKKFFDEWFEKRPVVLRRDSEYYERRLGTNLSSLDHMLRIQHQVKNRADLLHPETGVTQVKCAAYKGASMVERNEYKDEKSALRDGATLVCDLVPAYWKPASRLSMSLLRDEEDSPGFAFLTNMYVTPEGKNQGFGKHNDNKDVFIIQLAGRKEWFMQRTTFPLPLRHQCVGRSFEPSADTVTVDDKIESIILEAGDLLFLPRGYVHWAQTSENSTSMHWTLSATLNAEYAVVLDAFLNSFLYEPSSDPYEQRHCDIPSSHNNLVRWMHENLLNHLASAIERTSGAYLRSAVICDRSNITGMIETVRQRLERLFELDIPQTDMTRRVWAYLNRIIRTCPSRTERAIRHAFRSEKAGLEYIEGLLEKSLQP